MGTTSISFFRFGGWRGRLWAFSQMSLARAPLSRTEGLGFFKLFGTGGGESFRARPNPGVWAVLATWPDLQRARSAQAEAGVFRRYRAVADETYSVYLEAVSIRGQWDGRQPFDIAERPLGCPFAVLTRATVKPSKALAFWKDAPDIDAQTAREPALLFKRGMGEMPFLRQVTFSIWSDLEAMKTFAYRHPFHRDAARQARERNWFSEELFARFAVLGTEGSWEGSDPVGAALAATASAPSAAPRSQPILVPSPALEPQA
ncbi:MAG: spheroidene monooxygenase [Pikeienuella sp.]